MGKKSFYFEILEDEEDTIDLVKNLLNKLGIEVEELENKIDIKEDKIVTFNICIPEDRKDIINAFQGLINAFKNDIKVKY